VGFDYGPKLIRLLPIYHPTGSFEEDLARLQEVFRPIQGKKVRPAAV
jgi:hypothetical protein